MICDNKTDNGVDVYDWVLSSEIREYLRANHRFSVREKVEIVQGGCRPVEEKRAVLEALLGEAKDGKDRELIQDLNRMNDWCLEELQRECPGQVFLFLERSFRRIVELSCYYRTGNVTGVFCNYDEFMAFLDNFAAEYELSEDPTRVDYVAYAEKWVMVNGKMDTALRMNLYVGGGRLFIQRIWHWRSWEDRLGDISWEADRVFDQFCKTVDRLPLPFQNGDLVRVDIPDLEEPVYGVLNIAQLEVDRYIYLLYIEDHCLRRLSMSYQHIDAFSCWRVIDWTHPATAEELPAGQEILAELSNYLHRLEKTDKIAARELYLRLPEEVPLYHPGAKTLEDLLEAARELHPDK